MNAYSNNFTFLEKTIKLFIVLLLKRKWPMLETVFVYYPLQRSLEKYTFITVTFMYENISTNLRAIMF